VRILDITSEIPVPTFAAYILSDVPPETPGFGFSVHEASGRAAHPDPQVAVEMALLEATQTIITNVSGAREDLTLHARSLGRHERTRAQTAVSFAALRAIDPPSKAFADVPGYVARDCRADVAWLIAQLCAAGYDRVLVADYTRSEIEPARVVRAIVPGLETINPFRTGSPARRALLADLLPQ